MLKDGITDAWLRFKIFFNLLKTEEERIAMAKETFLFVVSYRAADGDYPKQDMLEKVVESCLAVVDHISEEEILQAFHGHIQNMRKSNRIISPFGMEWVFVYVKKSKEVRYEIELLVLEQLLRASSQWDKMRKDYPWMVSVVDYRRLVCRVLYDRSYKKAKRKMELAIEFGLPVEEYKRLYLWTLLREGHLEQAKELGVGEFPDIILDAIEANVHKGYNWAALDILSVFSLPNKNELFAEIQDIQAAFDA